jgi:hypothetical protein
MRRRNRPLRTSRQTFVLLKPVTRLKSLIFARPPSSIKVQWLTRALKFDEIAPQDGLRLSERTGNTEEDPTARAS